MDRLFARYADPYSFINGMIQTGRFDRFVMQLWETEMREQHDKELWEFFLHRVYDQSFDDFKEELKTNAANRNLSAETIETTVNNSLRILNKISPDKGGEA